MKSIVLLVLLALTFGATACREEGPAERAGQAIDEAVEDAGDAVEDAADEARKKARKSLE